MDELEKDVTPESSTGTDEEKVVKDEQESTPVQESQEVQQEQSSEPSQVAEPVVKDDRPLQNLYWEQKKKIDEIYPVLNELREVLPVIKGIQSQAPQQPQYTKAELQAFAADPTTDNAARRWAYDQVDKMDKAERTKEYENIVKSARDRSEGDVKRNQAISWVTSTFPDIVVKDQMGNAMSWNNSHPIFVRASEYMARNEGLRNDPEGFAAAVKMAAFDLGVNVSTNSKLNKTVGQLRKEQKKQLVSSGGTRPAETPESTKKVRYQKLEEEYRKTGNPDAFKEMLKMRNLIHFG